MTARVFITGLGCVTALGVGVERFWSGLVAGESGIRPLPSSAGGEAARRVAVGARAWAYEPGDWFPADRIQLLDRISQFALLAARQAAADAGLGATHARSAAVVLGTGCGGKETEEETYARLYRDGRARVHPLTIPRGMPSAPVSQVSMDLGAHGPAFGVTSACASSSHAVAQVALLIRAGLAEVGLAGGTDAPFTHGMLKAWEALRVLSPDACRPFARDRNGLVLGEGAGVLVLESEAHASRRGACVYAELAGIGLSSDAFHITDPSPDGAAAAMKAALEDGGLVPEDIDYINAHGTGTRANDPNETRAIRQVFGVHSDRLAVSSTKAAHGHALGAAGALELIATVLTLRDGWVPPTLNLVQPGEGCDLDYVPNQAVRRVVRAALSNSFAFGGLNAVLALRRRS